MNENNTNAWDKFAGTTATVNDRPDKYFCRVCNGIWTARGPVGTRGKKGFKPGARGHNRCQCGAIYSDDDLVKLKAPSDRFIHLLCDGIVVTVQRSHLQAVWSQYSRERRNLVLLSEQGVDISALAPVIPATTEAAPPTDTLGTPPAMPTPDDWARWASQEAQ